MSALIKEIAELIVEEEFQFSQELTIFSDCFKIDNPNKKGFMPKIDNLNVTFGLNGNKGMVVRGRIMDVCSILVNMAAANIAAPGDLAATMEKLAEKYGYHLKMVDGEVIPVLDLTIELIERLLNKGYISYNGTEVDLPHSGLTVKLVSPSERELIAFSNSIRKDVEDGVFLAAEEVSDASLTSDAFSRGFVNSEPEAGVVKAYERTVEIYNYLNYGVLTSQRRNELMEELKSLVNPDVFLYSLKRHHNDIE